MSIADHAPNCPRLEAVHGDYSGGCAANTFGGSRVLLGVTVVVLITVAWRNLRRIRGLYRDLFLGGDCQFARGYRATPHRTIVASFIDRVGEGDRERTLDPLRFSTTSSGRWAIDSYYLLVFGPVIRRCGPPLPWPGKNLARTVESHPPTDHQLLSWHYLQLKGATESHSTPQVFVSSGYKLTSSLAHKAVTPVVPIKLRGHLVPDFFDRYCLHLA
jgi:hypothetical protein